jgi:hypothetical protein
VCRDRGSQSIALTADSSETLVRDFIDTARARLEAFARLDRALSGLAKSGT